MIVAYSDLGDIKRQNSRKTIVLGGGSFDLIHFGYIQYLQALAEYSEKVVVAVKSNVDVALEKGLSRPIIPEIDRLRMVDAILGIDYCFLLPPGVSIAAAIKELQPDCFMTCNAKWKFLKKLNFTNVAIEPRFSGGHYLSTTAIIQHIMTTSPLE